MKLIIAKPEFKKIKHQVLIIDVRDNWEHQELEKYIYSIGNVTLMKKEWNERVGNELWSIKTNDKNYLENSWLKKESFGKLLLERKGEELYPNDIKKRANEVVKEIKKSEFLNLSFSFFYKLKKVII